MSRIVKWQLTSPLSGNEKAAAIRFHVEHRAVTAAGLSDGMLTELRRVRSSTPAPDQP